MNDVRLIISRRRFILVGAAVLLCTVRAVAVPQSDLAGPPADVAGRWIIYARNADGSSDTKTVEIKQDGNELSGHFKGPNQSGGIVGTVNGTHITFRTKTREILHFSGRLLRHDPWRLWYPRASWRF